MYFCILKVDENLLGDLLGEYSPKLYKLGFENMSNVGYTTSSELSLIHPMKDIWFNKPIKETNRQTGYQESKLEENQLITKRVYCKGFSAIYTCSGTNWHYLPPDVIQLDICNITYVAFYQKCLI